MRYRAIVNLGLSLAAVVFSLAAVELAARLIESVAPRPAYTVDEYRRRIPPPYKGAGYDVVALLQENIVVRESPDFGWVPEDHSSLYINIRGGKRRTVDQPRNAAHRVWLFGGSSVFGVEVPDSFTMPSLLQRLLNERVPQLDHAVENLGATSVTSRHQLYQLMHMTAVAPGDVVVFYDGVNDIYQSLYNRDPAGTMIEANRRVLADLPVANRVIFLVHHYLSPYSVFVDRFLDQRKPTGHTITIEPELLRELGTHYAANIEAAHRWTVGRGGRFFHFLQPSLFTVVRRTAYEQEVLANPWITDPALIRVYESGYPELRAAVTKLRARGIASADITDAFESRTGEIFLDFCHVTEEGNALVGDRIATSIAPALSQ